MVNEWNRTIEDSINYNIKDSVITLLKYKYWIIYEIKVILLKLLYQAAAIIFQLSSGKAASKTREQQ